MAAEDMAIAYDKNKITKILKAKPKKGTGKFGVRSKALRNALESWLSAQAPKETKKRGAKED